MFQAVLSAGVPVITTVQGDVRDLVESAGAGLTAEAEDVVSLTEVFRRASTLASRDRAAMARNGRAMYDEHFSRESGIASIEELLVAAAKGTSRGR